MLDISEVEGCRVSDDLNEVGIRKIGIGPRDGGFVGEGDGLRKRGAKVRVGRAAIAGEPAGVDVERGPFSINPHRAKIPAKRTHENTSFAVNRRRRQLQ